ncbi:Pollen-specific protein-like, partial [Mucuna pruriens]
MACIASQHGDHEEEICKVIADSPTEEAMPNKLDRIVLTKNMGVSSLARFVNTLGFMTQTIDAQCNLVVQELQLDKFNDRVKGRN